jgi:hypothetical protein
MPDNWTLSAWIYVFLAVLTLIPTLTAKQKGIKPNPAGITFADTTGFSEEARRRLAEHYSRLEGTLGFWKNRATTFTRFHYYCVIWTILSAWAVPLLSAIAPQVEGSNSKWLIVIISSHVALALSFHRGMKVPDGMKAFRHGESEFYDLYRRMLDRPHLFGATEAEQIDQYFAEVERVRRIVRNAETESLPDVETVTTSGSTQGRSSPKKK